MSFSLKMTRPRKTRDSSSRPSECVSWLKKSLRKETKEMKVGDGVSLE